MIGIYIMISNQPVNMDYLIYYYDLLGLLPINIITNNIVTNN